MEENYTEKCYICQTTNRDDYITNSSCYAKFFIQVMSVQNFNEELFLCMWCKAILKKAMTMYTLALESEKARHDKIPINKPKRINTLNYVHNSHIDISPFDIESQEIKTENITIEFEDISNSTNNITLNKEKPLLKRNKKQLKAIELPNDNENKIKMKITNEIENVAIENKITKKRNKKIEFNELEFEVEYLNLEEQLKDVEIKKLKYNDFKFQCNVCGMGFLTSDVFEEHKLRHSELSGPHKCSICSLHFKSPDVLSQHTLAHKRRFKCLICSSMFKRWSHCIVHRYKCGNVVQPIACEECSKIFSNEFTLKIHMKVHKTEKKYCCEQCDKKFINKQRLTVHLRSHSGIKPFSCVQCARSFTTSSNLRAHSAVHARATHFYCVECHTYYKTAKSLRRHFNESAKHATSRSYMYQCVECTKQFPSEKALSHHINTRHGSEHRCTHCDKTFSNNSNLNKHIKCIHTK